MLIDEALDRVRAGESAKSVAETLTAAQVREVAHVHAASLRRSNIASVDGDAAVAIVPARDEARPNILYEDIGEAFEVRGGELMICDGPSSMGSMLELLQYARDRSDTILYLEPAERSDRYSNLAALCGASVEFIKFLFAHYPQFQRDSAQ